MTPTTAPIDPESCRRLWQKVLLDGLKAAYWITSGSGQVHLETSWIGSRDFYEVCSMAGFDPHAIIASHRDGSLRRRLAETRNPRAVRAEAARQAAE